MKNILKITLGCFATLFILASCSDVEDGHVKVTHYAVFDVLGLNEDGVNIIELGSQFTDPGVVCMEGTKDITSTVKVENNVNANKVGIYTISYSAVNVDGFASSVSRTVFVYDPAAIDRDISGNYKVAGGSYRHQKSKNANVEFSGDTVSISKYLPGIYTISDFLGGYYDQRAKYGSSYAMNGYFQLDNDNTITALSAHVNGWNDDAENIVASYDEATGKIVSEVEYANDYIWYITLSK